MITIDLTKMGAKIDYNLEIKKKDRFLKLGFKPKEIHLYNPGKLGNQFFASFPKASDRDLLF